MRIYSHYGALLRPWKISRVTEGIRTVEMENWYLYLYLLGHHYFSKDSPYVCSNILQKLY